MAGILLEFWEFLRERRKLWLAPFVLLLVLLGGLLALAQATAAGPFLYALF